MIDESSQYLMKETQFIFNRTEAKVLTWVDVHYICAILDQLSLMRLKIHQLEKRHSANILVLEKAVEKNENLKLQVSELKTRLSQNDIK